MFDAPAQKYFGYDQTDRQTEIECMYQAVIFIFQKHSEHYK